MPVRLEQLLDELRPETRETVEAQIQTALRERPEELEQLIGVFAARWTQP